MIWGRSPVFELETLNACLWPLAVSAGSHLGDIGSHGEPSQTRFMGKTKPLVQVLVYPMHAWGKLASKNQLQWRPRLSHARMGETYSGICGRPQTVASIPRTHGGNMRRWTTSIPCTHGGNDP